MIRRTLFDLLLFFLPFVLYGIYWRLSGGQQPKTAPRPYPRATLFICGLVLVAASFIWWGLTDGGPANGTYVPARVQDGHVVPGQIEPGVAK